MHRSRSSTASCALRQALEQPLLAFGRMACSPLSGPTAAFASWAFAACFAARPDGDNAYTLDHTVSEQGQRRVAAFDLTKARSTPRVLVAPRGWTRERQVPGSHQEVLLARVSRCARRSAAEATLEARQVQELAKFSRTELTKGTLPGKFKRLPWRRVRALRRCASAP